MLIDFQSKFNHFNYFLFSDEVSSCDFEFSSVLRSSGWVGGSRRDGGIGEDMDGVWSVQQITLYWTFTTSANIYHHVFFSSPFLTLWSSQLDFLQIADKFWIGQFQSSSSFLFFSFTFCHMWFLVDKKKLFCYIRVM